MARQSEAEIKKLFEENVCLAVDEKYRLKNIYECINAIGCIFPCVSGDNGEYGEYYDSKFLMNRYILGPADFVDYLMEHRDLYPHGVSDEFYYQHVIDDEKYTSKSKKIDALNTFKFHYRNINKHEERMHENGAYNHFIERKEEIKKFTATEEDARIAALESELAAANQRIAELEAAQPAPDTAPEDAALTSQQKASLARQENTLNAWKPAIDAMVKVAVACGEEGKKLRQQPDLNMLFNEIDAELIDAQMEFFRSCLPDDHIDRIGGQRGKS